MTGTDEGWGTPELNTDWEPGESGWSKSRGAKTNCEMSNGTRNTQKLNKGMRNRTKDENLKR